MKNSTTITVNQNTEMFNLVQKHITISAQIDGLTKIKNEIATTLKERAHLDGLTTDNTIKYEYITKDNKIRHSTIVAKPNTKKVIKAGYEERVAELQTLLNECYEVIEDAPIVSATPYKLKDTEKA